MLCNSQIGLICFVINIVNCYNIDTINTFDKILRKSLSTNVTLRSDMDHCNEKTDRYSCLIGESMLSRNGEFHKMLVLKANSEKLVILSFADFAYVELAVNLHESLQAQHITNFLFICADKNALNILQRRGIDSVLYQHRQINSNDASILLSDDFSLKTSIKIKIITAAVKLGFQVLFTDADVIFLRNPIHHLISYNNADLVIQNDTTNGLNSGFMLVRPTYSGVTLMLRTLDIVMNRLIIDQHALNLVIKEMVSIHSLAMVVLDTQKFPCGKVYFEDEKRMFLEDRGKKDVAYIVHNNFLFTKVMMNVKNNSQSIFYMESTIKN